ncbi:hypothetical protein B0T14DRAFT_291134 [Immersiella caudata]|uniref:Uncharacterized protein n=1 Tax=Immersiella caudata TaxID=314043 RepID=A0AA40BUD8_9PEZI|nr:hypothetical protein B0T14DRAFT_291134 [Immersiella caudata]
MLGCVTDRRCAVLRPGAALAPHPLPHRPEHSDDLICPAALAAAEIMSANLPTVTTSRDLCTRTPSQMEPFMLVCPSLAAGLLRGTWMSTRPFGTTRQERLRSSKTSTGRSIGKVDSTHVAGYIILSRISLRFFYLVCIGSRRPRLQQLFSRAWQGVGQDIDMSSNHQRGLGEVPHQSAPALTLSSPIGKYDISDAAQHPRPNAWEIGRNLQITTSVQPVERTANAPPWPCSTLQGCRHRLPAAVYRYLT